MTAMKDEDEKKVGARLLFRYQISGV